MKMHGRGSVASVALGLIIAANTASALPERLSVNADDAMARLRVNTGGSMLARQYPGSAFTLLRADRGDVLHADNAQAAPEARARYFLSLYGAALGISDQASELALQRTSHDAAGNIHVHLTQLHEGLEVFGARLVVHMNSQGIMGVSGVFVTQPHVISADSTLDGGRLQAAALAEVGKSNPGVTLRVESGRWLVYPVGLIQGDLRESRLAYEAVISAGASSAVRDQVFLDAENGSVLNRIGGIDTLLNRKIYTPDQTAPPTYTEGSAGTLSDPPLINDPGHNGTVTSTRPVNRAPVDNLYIFAGGTYALYKNMFGREGYDDCDGSGPCRTPLQQVQKSVYLINSACPNAYWNGDSTNYCPGFDADDVVSHEWSHAYTEYTHHLIYQYQSGALNESYSDIFGETYDLVNKLEGPLGASLAEHKYYEESGSRWVVGEDLSDEAAALLLRDMWKPDEFRTHSNPSVANPSPGKVSSVNYVCGTSDQGGVHTNSGVSNHAYAMLVDGTTGQGATGSAPAIRNAFNGQSFLGIGIVKAAQIYFQAETHYQTPTTNYPQHADALEASCQDLKGVNLKGTTGALSGQMITQADCDVLHQDILATEMRTRPVQCNYQPLLKPEASTPALCANGSPISVLSEDWESGAIPAAWTLTSTGVKASSWDNVKWGVKASLPAPHTGKAAFALDATDGDCAADDNSGNFSLDSPAVTLTSSSNKLAFTHYVATEKGYDGGNLKYSLNNGAFAIVPATAFTYNGHTGVFNNATTGNNTSPLAGQAAWTGADGGEVSGSWGTTIVDIGKLGGKSGDKIKFRWDFGQDGCGGVDGWYVDNVNVFSCPVADPPVLSLGTDYENPDTNGSFTLKWTDPAGAIAPDVVQSSSTSCGPLFSDNAANLNNWTAASSTTVAPIWTTSTSKPQHQNNSAFWADPVSEQETQNTFATLTLKQALTLPPGTTKLKFSEWYFNENDDMGLVQVSTDNGSTWTTIYTNARPMGDLPDTGANAFSNEDLTPTTLDLSSYAGQSVKVRFKYALGPSNFFFFTQYGWYIDDIQINNDNWGDLLNPATSPALLTGVPNGTQCYRVRTSYSIGGETIPSPFSNVVTARVAVHAPPIAVATAVSPVIEGDNEVLDGSASSDPQGGTLTYRWAADPSNPVGVTLTNANSAKASFVAPDVCANKPFKFTLTVTAGSDSTSVDVIVVVQNHNTAPTADAGGDFSVGEGLSALLNAKATDPDCETFSYSWSQVEGPGVTLSRADTAAPSFVAPIVTADTPLVFRLTVTDQSNAPNSDDITVLVKDSGPSGPAIGDTAVGALPVGSLWILGLAALARRRKFRPDVR